MQILHGPLNDMGKRNNKSAKVAHDGSKSNSDSFPTFDENALSALTSKIEKDFGKPKSQKEPQHSNGREKEKKSRIDRKANDTDSKKKSAELVRGTKRDASGNKKVAAGLEMRHNAHAKDSSGGPKDDRTMLLQEILALGGTEEDLDLVADVLSDEEDEEPNAGGRDDKALQKEIANFAAGLGIQGGVSDDDIEVIETEEIEDGWEEASDLNSEEISDEGEEAAIVEPVKKITAPVITAPPVSNDPNCLVSTTLSRNTGPTDSQ